MKPNATLNNLKNLKTPGWRPRTAPYSLCSPKESKQRKGAPSTPPAFGGSPPLRRRFEGGQKLASLEQLPSSFSKRPLRSSVVEGEGGANTLNSKSRGFEIRLCIIALALCNLGLIKGVPATNLIFAPEAVASGEWWRLLTWPFVHVSPYHLLLDGIAFLLLYSGLNDPRSVGRIFQLLASAAGSLLLPLWLAPEIYTLGLCGLSGVAHGLFAVTALELATDNKKDTFLKKAGILLLIGVLLKCTVEMAAGQVFLSSLHLGTIGTPIVATHAGGALGGIAAFSLLWLRRQSAA